MPTECTPPVRRNDSTTDWRRAATEYLDAISSGGGGDEARAVRATLEIARLVGFGQDHAARPAVQALVDLLGKSPPPRLRAAAAQTLCSIAAMFCGRFAPDVAGGDFFPVVLRLLPCSGEVPGRVLLRCLCCVLSFDRASRVALARIGGAEVVLDLFPGCTDETKKHLVDIVSALALLKEVRRMILANGKVRYLVEAVSFGTMESRTRAAQAVGLLGISRIGRNALVDAGAAPALVALLKDGHGSAKLVAANALGIIASIEYRLPLVVQSGAIPLYAQLLKEDNPLGTDIVKDVFCNLASDKDNAALVLENLVGILRDDDERAKSSAVDVLCDLAEHTNIIPCLQTSGAMDVLMHLLQIGNDDIKEKVSEVVAHLNYQA